jgi:hypothetical protein
MARPSALRGKNRTKLSLLVQILENLTTKKSLFGEKSCTVMRTVKKIVNEFVNNSVTGRDISKMLTIWVQQQKAIFLI